MAINTKLLVLLVFLLSASFSQAYRAREEQDPEQELQQCQQQCESLTRRQSQQQKERCLQDCQRQYEERQESEQQQGPGRRGGGGSQEQEQQEQQGGQQNPYLFHSERLSAKVTSPHGSISVLERFNRRSELLQAIQNYRVVFYEASPNSFMLPNHWDADTIAVVTGGRGSITLIRVENKETKRETHDLKVGDIIRIFAGTTVHFVNKKKDQNFTMVELAVPVNIPGRFESFFPASSKDQQSYFSALGDQILQAAFNVDRVQLRKLFRGQNEGQFVGVSEQQIKALSQPTGQLPWPFHEEGRQSSRPYNIFNQEATESNQYGDLYEVSPEKYKQLQDLDVQVTYAKINKGAMATPFYNTRATKIGVAVIGAGYIQMASPHLGQQQGQRGGSQQQGQRGGSQQKQGTQYQTAEGQIKDGDVFVVPAGHPIVTVASNDRDLELICFEIAAANNERVPLAGKNNILSELQDVAKELSFNIKASELDQILKQQKNSWFLPGPQQQQQGQQHQGYSII